jgi:copper(I)-binding protein
MMTARYRLLLTVLALLSVAATAAGAEPGLTVREAWARATPPGTTVAAAYLTLVGGAQPDRLVGATTARAAMTQIHVVTEAEGMARMRPVDGVDIPARKTVLLAPQGLHLMLMRLSQPLVAGERFPLTLTFAQAGEVDVEVAVRSPDEPGPPGH